MLTTTGHRTHWIDSHGRRYAQLRPFTGRLQPVINLDEMRAWADLGRDDTDGRLFYARQFLRDDCHPAERERLAPHIAEELTDDVPRYHDGIRAAYIASRDRWPLPDLGGPAEIRNLTPHEVVVGEMRFAPSGVIARAIEESTPAAPIRISIPDPSGGPTDRIEHEVPTSMTRYTALADLPAPEPGVYLIVSMVIPPVAAERGRWTGDLLVPGQQVRDPATGRIVGCRSLARHDDGIEPDPGWEQRAEDRARREGVL